jgi:2-keto-3-deoxy-L-rhamnonate aldolase RhmA
MALRLMFITNNEEVAKAAEEVGVDWIFLDLEIRGKVERQGHLDTVISRHELCDVRRIASVLSVSKLLVRVNPLYEDSQEEVDAVIESGADIVMLPLFTGSAEVEEFVSYVKGRAATCLLLETPQAVENLDSILAVSGIDYVHVGLNDLHLGYGLRFMFELLANGTVERICNRVKQRGIPFGFGGVARLGQGTLPAELILAEHYRLGSSMVILSRSFCDTTRVTDIDQIKEVLKTGVAEIREYEAFLRKQSYGYFANSSRLVESKVQHIVESLGQDL